MKYLKSINEYYSEPTLKEKLESIVSMYEYLCSNDMWDSLNNFVGECSVVFMNCLDINSGWGRKSGIKPYELYPDKLLSKIAFNIDHNKSNDMNMSKIENLYKLSLVPRFDKTKEDIENLIRPVLDIEIFGEAAISEFEIEQYYDGWLKKPCFSIELSLADDLILVGSGSTKKETEREFYFVRDIIEDKMETITLKIKENNLYYEIHDSASFGKFHTITICLKSNLALPIV